MTYLGNCRLGELFSSRKEKGRPGLPTLSVTRNHGLVNRSDLERKQETSLLPQEHLLVKPGDIAYNMMRMWQGAFGLATCEGLVSPAYVVLAPKSGIDSRYASLLFESNRMAYLFWAYSYGITDDRLRLYYYDFARIPVTVPSIGEQRRFAALLATWDDAIRTKKAILSAETAIHAQHLNELTTGSKRISGSSGVWKEFTLAELGSTYGGLTGKSKEHFGHGKPFIPYKNIFKNSRVDVSKLELVAVGLNEDQNRCQVGDMFFTSSSETAEELGTASVLLDDVGEVYLNSFCIGYRLHNFSVLLPKFARYLFRGPALRRSLDQLAQGYTRFNLSKKELLKIKLWLPSLEEQELIADSLALSESRLGILQHELDLLRLERSALLQHLMSCATTTPRPPRAGKYR